MQTYTHAISERAEHVTEVEVAPFDRVDTGKEQAPLDPMSAQSRCVFRQLTKEYNSHIRLR